MMPGRFGFLPHARNAVAANANSSGARLSSQFDVAILGDGAQQGARLPLSTTLRGPGDVIGISPTQIARFEPAPGQRGFEPDYFPFVEFVDADFPWRYSLDRGNPARLSPWLALIALTADEFTLLDQGRAPLPRLTVHSIADSLPDLAEAWGCAHVQVNLDDEGLKSTKDMLQEDPANGFSRLFCLRQLAPRTRYHLFLVPLYEIGRVVGLGQSMDPSVGGDLAWRGDDVGAVELPYFSASDLTTDEGANIEELARKLRAFTADGTDETGAPRRANANTPGYYPLYAGTNQSFEIQTALTQTGHKIEPFNTDPALSAAMVTTLSDVIAGEGDAPDNDPLVAFPAYGFRFRSETEASVARASKDVWFDRINLDLKMRHAAARGAAVVHANQDMFAKAAWDQLDTVLEANQKLRQLQLAQELADHLARKHVRKLPGELVTVLAEPMQPYAAAQKGAGSIVSTLSRGGSPTAYASRGMRRIASKRPVKSADTQVGCRIPSPSIKGAPPSASAPQRPLPTRRPRPTAAAASTTAAVASGTLTNAINTHFVDLFGPFTPNNKPQKTRFEVAPMAVDTFATSLREAMTNLPNLKADFIVKGRTEAERKELAPLWRSPRIPEPLAKQLTDLQRDAILSDMGNLPDNSVSLFVENRAFIEAFMVGANHAMNDELRWREFPTDMRGTIFDRFWDRGAAVADLDAADISRIDQWAAKLGQNANPSNADGNPALVVVIKGDIVRKMGDPIVVVNKGSGPKWAPGSGTDFIPEFFGKMGRDTAYFGFDLPNAEVMNNPDDYRLVIMEPIGRLRFGLDVATATVRRERQDTNRRSLPFPATHRPVHLPAMLPATKMVAPPAKNNLTDWDDLSWSHMDLSPAAYVELAQTLTTQNGPNYWGSAKTSAGLARSFWQKPLAAVLPFSRVLP